MWVEFSHKVMPLFNGSFTTKKFQTERYPPGYFRSYLSHHSNSFFPVQKDSPIEKWKELGFIHLKSKFE